mmetsp:Transcript_33909/g.81550  ORF Transcript_33909/g.81550 Transcript_33909/m.81550 type:complete len:96 (+) Transcript_33909:612-899(+)
MIEEQRREEQSREHNNNNDDTRTYWKKSGREFFEDVVLCFFCSVGWECLLKIDQLQLQISISIQKKWDIRHGNCPRVVSVVSSHLSQSVLNPINF